MVVGVTDLDIPLFDSSDYDLDTSDYSQSSVSTSMYDVRTPSCTSFSNSDALQHIDEG
jgi:hypothetical protein